MTQVSKVLDVSRSFIPVDPNAYPENLHSTDGEDAPEKRIPVVPYMGFNFLPTSYGYKSYFGMNSKVNITSLLPNKADAIMVFQTLTYKNILIALCDTGIFYKASSVTGGWSHGVVLAAPGAGTYYEWTYTIIKNKLYAFRANGSKYYIITTDPGPAGIIITEVTPTFLSLVDQLGMFRLGARLAFWDTNNAIAWANPDNLADFTPKVLTGANVTTFNSISGRIAAIRPHGTGAIAYASKSVTQLQVNPSETFFVKAIPILTNTGIAYAQQSCEATPDTTHFAYTDTGIYKIENNRAEIIIPEIWDHLGQLSDAPTYLKVLAGRHLFFNVMDPLAIVGRAQFSQRVIPPSSVTFPGGNKSLEAINAKEIAEVDICDVTNKLTDNFYTEQQAAGDLVVPPSMRKPNTSMSPRYTCYISDQGGLNPDFEFIDTPCGATKIGTTTKFKPAPNQVGGTLASLTTTSVNKTAKTGAQMYVDGKWTMERFTQYQTALWKQQESNIKSFVDKLTTYGDVAVPIITANITTCAASSVTAFCEIGQYPTVFSKPQFGFNKCSFWLTRYALKKTVVTNHVIEAVACVNNPSPVTVSGYMVQNSGGAPFGAIYGSAQAALTAYNAALTYVPFQDGTQVVLTSGANAVQGYAQVGTANAGSVFPVATWVATGTNKILVQLEAGLFPSLPIIGQQYPSGTFDSTRTQTTGNGGVESDITPTPETAYCELTGWEYTNTAGVKVIAPVTGGCTDTNDKYPKAAPSPTRAVPQASVREPVAADGSFCAKPLELPDLPGFVNPIWVDESVIYPGVSFLTQDGNVAPKFPTFYGALVYDLHLKKWGKMKGEFKQLLDYSPINSAQNDIIKFDNFGIMAGALKADGNVYVFDNYPIESQMTWGKIGYYRLGVTDAQVIRVDFKANFTGEIINEVSLDGIHVASDMVSSSKYAGVQQAFVYPKYTGKWHNVTVKGRFDIAYMEFIGVVKGRR